MKTSSPKPPPDTTEEIALRQRQVGELSKLNDEENKRIKGLLRAQSSGRLFSSRGGGARRARGASVVPAGALGKAAGGYNVAYTSRAFSAIPKKK